MISYRIGTEDIDWQQIAGLYRQVGLVGGLGERGDLEAIRKAFQNSYRVVTAWDDVKLVGAARMLSDGICYAMVFDVGVLPDYHRRGIGTGLIKSLMTGCENMSVHLTSRFGIEDLYRKLGFRKHGNAFTRYPAHRFPECEAYLVD